MQPPNPDLVLEFSQLVSVQPQPMAFRASFEFDPQKRTEIELGAAPGTIFIRRSEMFCSAYRFHFNFKISFATWPKPVRHMNVVNEIRKSMTAYGHDFHQLFIDQVQLTAVEPESAAIPAVIQNDIAFTKESNG